MPNISNTIVVGKQPGIGYKLHYFKDTKGRFFGCHVLSQQAGPTYTIKLLSRATAGVPRASVTLTGIPPAASKASTNAVHPSVRLT